MCQDSIHVLDIDSLSSEEEILIMGNKIDSLLSLIIPPNHVLTTVTDSF